LERKLTAILCADVFGYSRLMGDDEEATLRTLSSHRKLIDSLVEQHRGRFVNSAGDSVLAEFASVVNAVQCAVEIQTTLKAENANIPPERRMEFRIGVNLGDVMVDSEQIYGDGVNVAARLESLAEPGGICISAIVHDQIKNKVALSYEDLGAQQVKNIAEPVRVFRVLTEAGGAATPTRQTQGVARKYVRRGVFSIAGLAIIAATIIFVEHLFLRPPTPSVSIPPAQPPALPLPDKPSIAVLPFTNMSGDRDQEYFSDGITDDIITALSRLPDLFVIARTSTFTYKGKAAKVQDISRDLGVAYVLEGSVRKAGDNVRITAQLVDASSGDHLWAEHYDRPLKDIFSLQDEIVRRIITTLKLQLPLDMQWKDIAQIAQHTDNPEAYDDYLRGVEYVKSFSAEGILKARQMFEKAIELDPAYTDAYGWLGYTYWWSWYSQYGGDDPSLLDRAIRLEQQAIALDDAHADLAHANLCRFYPFKRQYDQAVTECQRAIELAPSCPHCYFSAAETSNRSGKPREAIGFVEKAERLDPRNRGLFELDRGAAYILMGRYAEAIPIFKAYFVSYPHVMWAHVWQAVAYSELGREQEARAEAVEIMRISPGFSLKAEKERMSLQDQALEERYLNDLRKAGLK
jgi:adenylate cyclase